MNRPFDFYEYAGIVVPGTILCLGLLWLFPDWRGLFGKEGVTFGELGLFIIVAYAAGQLTQGIGNWLEWFFWKLFGGMPSVQLFDGKLVGKDQQSRVTDALRNLSPSEQDLTKVSARDRRAIVHEMYVSVSMSGQAARIDTFNGNYGLMRGLSATFLVVLVGAALAARWIAVLAVGILLVLSLQRMYRFGRHYALELIVRYLALTKQT
jgi:hypothetical protein